MIELTLATLSGWLDQVNLVCIGVAWFAGAPVLRAVGELVATIEMTRKAAKEAVEEALQEAEEESLTTYVIASKIYTGARAGVVETWPTHCVDAIELGNGFIKTLDRAYGLRKPYKLTGF